MNAWFSNRLIFLMLFYTATIWGVNVTIIKLLTEQLDVMLVSALRMFVASITIGVFVLLQKGRIPGINRQQFLWLLFISFFLVYGHQVLLAKGLQLSTATNGSLILALNPLFSVVSSFIFFKERIRLSQVIGVVLGFFGVFVIVTQKAGAQLGSISFGDFILFISMVAYVLGALGIRKMAAGIGPLLIAFYMHLLGSFMLFVHSSFMPSFFEWEAWNPSLFGWLLVLISGIASTALGNLFWSIGISRIGVAKTSMFFNWLPVSGLISAFVFLGETIQWIQLAGLSCILMGIYLGVQQKKSSSYDAASISVK